MKKIYVLFSVMAMLASCASNKDKDADLPVEDLYNKAYEDLQATRYKKAAEGFERVEVEHPYSQWAVKSKLMGAYAYYKDEKYDDAIMAADRFIRYHPGNKDVAYAYYLKGMSYYDQISSADKDQGNTEKAEETFSRLVALFPDSEYAEDARNKLNLTKDYKAGQEMIVGRYYLQQGNYLSALNRFNVVLENYQTTVQIEEALYRQVEIYGILGMNKYAQGYYKILKQNYPDGKWTEKAAKIMTIIDDMYDALASTDDSHKIEQMGDDASYLWKKVKEMRKSSLEKNGESGSGNIVYKILRRTGYLDRLFKLSNVVYDKFNSITESTNVENIDIFSLAKERFGTTNDIRECGYVLPDGSMLDFSGRHMVTGDTDTSHLKGRRSVDHREIGDLNWDRDMTTRNNLNINSF